MDNSELKNGRIGPHVFIFPARTSDIDGKRIFYLFSFRQVAEIMTHTKILPVPFGPQYTEGVAEWHGRVLPVLSLEKCLGIKLSDDDMPQRTIVVRSVAKDMANNLNEVFVIFKVGAAVRQLDLPRSCVPAAIPDWVTNATFLSGIYQLQERLLLVIDIEAIINSENHGNQNVSKSDIR